ncbi:hypothetical protein GI374_12485 [Paracoccus sp. S-4012]|uniref:hypothetical protein n=1 Tax=Paracoccus sp. S-4012 TaxID=2665648 RepID=UPI0012B0AAC5|nr:hypothetical protein [Paracoccus sp. S-4012]MRX51247.1 hypothetical protein [Paracoccus sp. S-4012]
MSRIPFIEARFHDPEETEHSIETRFLRFLRQRRSPGTLADAPASDSAVVETKGDDDDDPDHWLLPKPGQRPLLTSADLSRIRRRARRISELRKQRTPGAAAKGGAGTTWCSPQRRRAGPDPERAPG